MKEIVEGIVKRAKEGSARDIQLLFKYVAPTGNVTPPPDNSKAIAAVGSAINDLVDEIRVTRAQDKRRRKLNKRIKASQNGGGHLLEAQ